MMRASNNLCVIKFAWPSAVFMNSSSSELCDFIKVNGVFISLPYNKKDGENFVDACFFCLYANKADDIHLSHSPPCSNINFAIISQSVALNRSVNPLVCG